MRIAISACLLGDHVRYDGGSKPAGAVVSLASKSEVVRVCPECAGGLPIPRLPAEQRGKGVFLSDGTDVTEAFYKGAEQALRTIKEKGATLAVLKAKSPSCGTDLIYDGTYSGHLIPGSGVLTRVLKEEGIVVVDEKIVGACAPSVEHPVALVLGSGLGHLGKLVKPVRHIEYHEIEGFPAAAHPIPGHSFEVTVGTIDEVPVVVYPGRVHLYQGFDAWQVSSLVRHAHHLGCKSIVFACATGAVQGKADLGLGIISDQINLTGKNPLACPEASRVVDSTFVGMNPAFSPYLSELARGVAEDLDIPVGEGVYAGVLGPCFETPAEVGMLAQMGASYVGMSLVCETIMAKALGMEVLGLTLATNYAGEASTDHASVLEEAECHAGDFEALVRGVLRML